MTAQGRTAAADAPRVGTPAYSVFGLALDIAAVDERDQGAVDAASREWLAPVRPAGAPLEVRVTSDTTLSGTHDSAIEASGARLTLSGSAARGAADATRRIARCAVSTEFLCAPELLHKRVLEPLVLFMATRNGRTPVHASGFVLGGLAVLLAGPSGAGKSCLALAADRSGHQVLSDDTVYVEQAPCLRVWGMPDAAHLLTADSIGLPASKQRLRAGRLKNVVPLRSAAREGPISCDRATLCVLRKGAAPALRRIARAEALSRLGELDAGFDLLRQPVLDATARLASRGAWELTLSREPDAAIALLERSLPLLRQTAAW